MDEQQNQNPGSKWPDMPANLPKQEPSPIPQGVPQTPPPSPQKVAGQINQNIPPPPPPEINVRTMESDVNAVKQSGGEMPAPKPFIPEMPPVKPEAKLSIPGYTGPEEPIFTPQATISGAPEGEAKKKVNLKTMEIVGGIIVVAVGFGFLGYYVLFPMFFPTKTNQPAALPTPVPTSTAVTTPVATSTLVATSTPALVHKSFFVTPANKSETITLNAVDLVSIKVSLINSSKDNLPVGTLKEISFSGPMGLLTSGNLIKTLWPTVDATSSSMFEDDSTSALHYDNSGAWAVFIFKLKPGVVPASAQTAVAAIEKPTSNTSSFFFVDAGTPSVAGFKNGQAGGKPIRFLTYSNAKAFFSYSWMTVASGNYLIISTSYPGLVKVENSLGK